MRKTVLAVAAILGLAGSANAATLLNQTSANGHTYQLWYEAAGLTWGEAEARAVAAGGHLASIADASENALLYGMIGSNAEILYLNDGNRAGPFLGGFRATNGGPFAWSDGTAWSYTNWASGEPSNYGGQENYLAFFATGPDAVDEPNEGSFWNDVGPNPSFPTGKMTGYFVELPGGAVPEPAQWALLIGGFGLVGASARRRRTGVVAAVTA
jgi:hypothetical protein